MEDFGDFMGMFGMGDLFGDQGFGGGTYDDEEFDDFMSFLEKDNVSSFKSLFRNLGRNYAGAPGKPIGKNKNLRTKNKNKQASAGINKKAAKEEEAMMEDMMAMMMMGNMMEMGKNMDEDMFGGGMDGMKSFEEMMMDELQKDKKKDKKKDA